MDGRYRKDEARPTRDLHRSLFGSSMAVGLGMLQKSHGPRTSLKQLSLDPPVESVASSSR
jgi:hypothetical protein